MHVFQKTALLTCLLMMAACQPPGSYDSHGNYHSSDKGFQGESAVTTQATDDRDAVAYTFAKAGFYDAQGKYAGDNGEFGVVTDFLPPRSMCRIWTPDKPASLQPPAEPCREKYHLRSTQYVIYGG
jgi:hypothetical protein